MKITFQNVSKVFKKGKNQLSLFQDLNFEIQTGEIISLVGKSGSGKSTIVSLMGSLDRDYSGKIFVDQLDLSLMNSQQLSKLRSEFFGFVFQQFHLIPHLTAFENISLPLEILGKRNDSLVLEWLNRVGLSERKNHLPKMLSGGEEQRVAIARAFIHNPKIIFADEPSGNLDFETGTMIMNMLFAIVREQKTTMVLVTHDKDLAEKTDRKLELIHGKIQS